MKNKDNTIGTVECYGCGHIVAKSRTKEVIQEDRTASFHGDNRIVYFCEPCKPNYDRKVYGGNGRAYWIFYKKNPDPYVRVNEDGSRITPKQCEHDSWSKEKGEIKWTCNTCGKRQFKAYP